MQISCIIPIYNEETRITAVLEAVSQTEKVDEIICVDDGSTDNSSEIIKKNFPRVRLLRQKTNLGKTAAVATGLKSAHFETILLLDSDLINLKNNELSKAITAFEQQKLDCLLLNTAPMNLLDKLFRKIFRFLLTAAGNRIIYKKDLEEVRDLCHSRAGGNPALKSKQSQVQIKGYQLEIMQNYYLMTNRKNVAYFDISAKDVSKIDKVGFIKGWRDELKMWKQIVGYAGVIFFVRQSLSFARKKI